LNIENDEESRIKQELSAFPRTRIGKNKTRPKPGKVLGTTAKSAGESAGGVRGPFPGLIVERDDGLYQIGLDDDALGPFPTRSFAEAVAGEARYAIP
jgi:hypothetical protein